MIDIYNISNEEYLEDLFSTSHLSGNPTFSSHIDLTSPEVINPLSGSTTFSSPTLISLEESELIWEEFEAYLASDSFPLGNDDLVDLLPEEFADELALIESFPSGNDDMTPEDVIKEVKCLLTQSPLANYSLDNDLINTILEMFTDEHTLDYSSPPLYDDVDDDLDYSSHHYKIKESKLLIDELNELDPPRSSDFLPSLEYDSVFYEDFSEVDALPSTNNEDKVFNPGILIHENLLKVTNCATPDKNVKKSTYASLILDPPYHELPLQKEVPGL
ncbi:hypothetical protein Tco_1375559 [Tanacetum coccineum]